MSVMSQIIIPENNINQTYSTNIGVEAYSDAANNGCDKRYPEYDWTGYWISAVFIIIVLCIFANCIRHRDHLHFTERSSGIVERQLVTKV